MFAVFGMNREYAKRQAIANVKMVKNRKPLSQAQYQKAFDSYVNNLMDSERVVKLSPMLSTPEIAKQWMELAKKDGGRRLEICIHHPHKEVVKKGGPKVHFKWSFFSPGRDYSLKALPGV
ncbi:MAG: hypothetical protein ACI9DO_003405 [Reinekea sp.]|jgi:hypothetical protein|uniref:hypothetical protein n=1 Tax=Reinekea sp. TaxID=1970455 RepID=UPI003988FBFA